MLALLRRKMSFSAIARKLHLSQDELRTLRMAISDKLVAKHPVQKKIPARWNLTAEEKEVLKLKKKRMSDDKVAVQLHLKPKSVRIIKMSVLAKIRKSRD